MLKGKILNTRIFFSSFSIFAQFNNQKMLAPDVIPPYLRHGTLAFQVYNTV